MRTRLSSRVALGALALLTTLASVAPAAARSPAGKVEPRRVVPYRVGGTFRPDTNVLSVSGYAAWMIDEVLDSTTPLPPLGAAFLRAEREQGINARYLVAHAMLESGWGSSDIARLKRNLFGFNAYDRNPWEFATRFASHARGVAAVAAFLGEFYLTPGGRWWYRYTTPRAINRYYASDPRWADKVANIANIIDRLVVTLRERGVRFQPPALTGAPLAGAPAVLAVPWRASPGAKLPAALRFAARWTPLAVVEASAETPAAAPGAPWRFAVRADGGDHLVRLGVEAPPVPGLYRLDVEARDSDGQLLPATDRPPIPSLEVRVLAPGEVGVALAVGDSGDLVATVTVAGLGPAVDEAAPPGSAATRSGLAGATLEVWTLPLDPGLDAGRQARVALPDSLGAGATWTVPVSAPATPAVIVARIAAAAASGIRAVPGVMLAGRDADGRLTLSPLAIASPRDDLLLGREPPAAPITLRAFEAPGSLEAEIAPMAEDQSPDAGEPAPDGGGTQPTSGMAVANAPAAPEDRPQPRVLLVRSLAAEAAREAAPARFLLQLPEGGSDPAPVAIPGLPAGVRLVIAGLVPPGGGLVDPATLSLAWIAVAVPPEVAAGTD